MRGVPGGWFLPSVFQFKGFKTSLSSLSLGPLNRWGICPAATMSWEGCNTFSQPGNLIRGLLSAMDYLAIPTVASSSGVLTGVLYCGHLLWNSNALKDILIGEREVTPHLFSKLLHTHHQQAWFPFSRQINLLHPKLEGSGICHHLFMLDFLNVLTSKDGVGQWQEVLLEKTQQCRWGLMVVLHPM